MSEKGKPMGRIVVKCWEDKNFRQQLMADPKRILKTEGLKIPEGMSVTVVQQKENEIVFVIPNKPADVENQEFPLGCFGGSCTMQEVEDSK